MLAALLQKTSIAAKGAAKDLKKTLKDGKAEPSSLVICFIACVCAVLPLDISQMSFAIIGAVLYALLQNTEQLSSKKTPVTIKKIPQSSTRIISSSPKQVHSAKIPVGSTALEQKKHQSAALSEVRKPSAVPVVAPTFQSNGWEAEVQELLVLITPTPEVGQVVDHVARVMQQVMRGIVPEVEVVGYANANFNCGKAFGVAVPEVDIVATVSPQVLFHRLNGQKGRDAASFQELDAKKLQKHAIRAFTDRLVSSAGGFKFRRSAFRGQEPKVTLLAPASLGVSAEAIPIDFSVNVLTPLYNAALLTECGLMDRRAKELIFLVKRWAKDRGICHAAKGHLSPYIWSLLSVYFLQHGATHEGAILPSFDQFEMSSGLAADAAGSKASTSLRKTSQSKSESDEMPKKSAGALFKQFVSFFHAEFDWRNEAVSIRSGRRAPPALDLPLHIIAAEGSKTSQVGPSIEDPFQAGLNLGDCMNAMSLARLKEELARAEELCTSGASLTELLEPWSPPDASPQAMTEGCEDFERSAKDQVRSLPAAPSAPHPWRRK